MATRQQVEQYLQDENVRRYLDLLAYTEGTEKHGYHTKYGGGRIDDLSQHPNKVWGRTGDGATTATGRYQFIGSTFNEQAKKLGLKDFSPQSQDLAAVNLIAERGAIQDIINGDIDSANRKLSNTWASLPYNKSPHQHQKSIDDVAKKWNELAGKEYMQASYEVAVSQPQKMNSQPASNTSIANQLTNIFAPTSSNNAFADYFQQINGTLDPLQQLTPPTQPKNNRLKYQEQLAQAFGIEPQASNGLGENLSNLVESIYDQA